MRKVKFFLTVLSLFAVSFAWAQNITVKVTVTKECITDGAKPVVKTETSKLKKAIKK